MDKAVLGGNTIMVVVINIMGSIIVELGRLFGSDLIIRATMPLIIISCITENPSGCNVIRAISKGDNSLYWLLEDNQE